MPEPDPDPAPDHRRRTFGPVVLLGLASAAVAAVAGHRPWAQVGGAAGERVDAFGTVDVTAQLGEMPAAGALALVALACWGVLLVTRGRVRRVVAAVALLAALGIAATVVAGYADVPDAVRASLADLGLEGSQVSRTAWFWASAVGALGSVVASALALRLAPHWPEMGARYDAPAVEGAPVAAQPPEDRSSIDLWKDLDEGHDPTA